MTYIINWLPTQLFRGVSPFEILHGKAPLYINFGYRVYPCLRDYASNKLSPCIFLGYNPFYKGYHCLQFFLGYNPFYKGYHCLDPFTSKIRPQTKFDELNFPLIPNSIAQPIASLYLSSFSAPIHAHDPPLSMAPLPIVS